MSIYDFIDSPDIRQHLEQIGYKPSPLEMAWLIWQKGMLNYTQEGFELAGIEKKKKK